MIEHRHTKRINVSTKVSIYHQGNIVADCKVKDLSIEGLALTVGHLQFQRNTMLEVEFKIRKNPEPETFRLPAMVVHSTNDVLGLMFSKISARAQKAIRQLMRAVDEQRQQTAPTDVIQRQEPVWNSRKKAASG